jgi:hypothetical protein
MAGIAEGEIVHRALGGRHHAQRDEPQVREAGVAPYPKYTSVANEALSRLVKWPPDAVAIYRNRYEGEAAALFARLYRERPDRDSAEGTVLSLARSERFRTRGQ